MLYFSRYCCHVAVSVLCLFLVVLRVGLWSSVTVVFPGHTHFLFTTNFVIKQKQNMNLFYTQYCRVNQE